MHKPRTELSRLTAADVDAVGALARTVWQVTYPPLISQAQIDFMLADRYAPQPIRDQLDDPCHAWRVARQNEALVGFAHALCDETGCKLDKLYVHPHHQCHGIGTALLQEIAGWARTRHTQRLWLQVNRCNVQAIHAYEKYGFRIVASRVFELGNGFVMDDHVMELTL